MKYFFKKIQLDTGKSNGYLSGFGNRNKQSKYLGIEELYITVFWLKETTNDIVFISIDTLYIPVQISKPIYKHLEENFHISSDKIIFNATHTHSAPGIEECFDKNTVDMKYVDYICETILKVFINKTINFIDGNMIFQSQKISNNLLVSRRKIGRDVKSFFFKKKMLLLPNYDNFIDDSLRIFFITDRTSNLQQIIYNFSCHPVFNRTEHISSDFIGKINATIKRKFGVESIFLQGFLGDIKPNYTTNNLFEINFINKLKVIFNGRVFKPLNRNYFNKFCNSIAKDIIENYNAIRVQNNLKYNIKNTIKTYTLLSDTGNTHKKLSVKFALLDKILFISIPAEVTSKYLLELFKTFSQYNIVPLGMADGIIGYLPFYTETKEGGYEVNSAVNYGWDTKISAISLKEFYLQLEQDISNFIEVKKCI